MVRKTQGKQELYIPCYALDVASPRSHYWDKKWKINNQPCYIGDNTTFVVDR